MRSLVLRCIIILAFSTPLPALAQRCDVPRDDREIASCLGQELRLTDQRINEIYKILMGNKDETGRTALRNEQRA